MHTLSGRRLVCALVLLALIPFGLVLPAVATLGILAAALAAPIAYEAVRYAESRDRIRHQLAHEPVGEPVAEPAALEPATRERGPRLASAAATR
jgi:hypothetical protein